MKIQNMTVKFSKKDKFNNAVFIVREEEYKPTYQKLLKLREKINKVISKDTSNPLYLNTEHKFIKIRLANSRNLDLFESSVYELQDVSFRKTKKGNEVYVNIYAKTKLIKKYELGEELEFSDSDTE